MKKTRKTFQPVTRQEVDQAQVKFEACLAKRDPRAAKLHTKLVVLRTFSQCEPNSLAKRWVKQARRTFAKLGQVTHEQEASGQ